jgi:ketosteroid isomerase-like protein
MGEDSASVIQRLFDGFNAKDYDGIVALAADDFELIDCASGEKYSGPEGARQNAERWLIPFPDAKVELLNIVSSGDWAVAEAVGRGTHSGPMQTPMGEVAPTGRPMELHFCSIIKVRDGKIVEERDYYDAMTIVNQLGLMPEPAASSA